MAGRPPVRARVSRRRYMARRALVGAVLGVAVIGLVQLIGGLFGGSESPSIEIAGAVATSEAAETSGVDDVAPGAAGAEHLEAPDGAGPVGLAAGGDEGGAGGGSSTPRGPPTVDDPARVLILGDSDAGTFGPYLQQLLRESNVVETDLDYKVSSGLARPDFYDWHAALEQKVPAFDPDIVVVTFGGNDAQFLADRDGASVVGQARPDSDNAEWTDEYRARVRQVVEYLTSDPARTVVWVGIPNHADPAVRFRMQVQDEAVKAELAEWPEVRFVDAWSRFAGRSGGFAQFLIDPRDGVGKSVRAADGFHLNRVGAEILAIDIAGVVFAELRERGAEI